MATPADDDGLTRLVPGSEQVPLEAELKRVGSSPTTRPFNDEVLDFSNDLSKRLMKVGPSRPDIQALAFWMRRSAVHAMKESFHSLESDFLLMVPRGTVVHFPPANVETMFVYSWLLGVLTGNRNIVRVSARSVESAEPILEAISEVVAGYPGVSRANSFVTFPRNDALTSSVSRIADVRVLWGGDASVTNLKAFPSLPHCRDVVFPDRSSIAVIDAEAYLQATPDDRELLAQRLYTDVYWFDQMGCSSPQRLFWLSEASALGAQADFWPRFHHVLRERGYHVDTSTALAKIAYALGASVDAHVESITWQSNELMRLSVRENLEEAPAFCGAGTLLEGTIERLADIMPFVSRRTQTLAVFGIPLHDAQDLARALNGKGIDRIVPIGQALSFNRVWDGIDLLQEFTRKVSVA